MCSGFGGFLGRVTVYDAMYISASPLEGVPLLSFDIKMCEAAAE